MIAKEVPTRWSTVIAWIVCECMWPDQGTGLCVSESSRVTFFVSYEAPAVDCNSGLICPTKLKEATSVLVLIKILLIK